MLPQSITFAEFQACDAGFLKALETSMEPVYVTHESGLQAVVLDAVAYRYLQEQVAWARFLIAVHEGERSAALSTEGFDEVKALFDL